MFHLVTSARGASLNPVWDYYKPLKYLPKLGLILAWTLLKVCQNPLTNKILVVVDGITKYGTSLPYSIPTQEKMLLRLFEGNLQSTSTG